MISSANFFFLKVSFTAVKEKSTKSCRGCIFCKAIARLLNKLHLDQVHQSSDL